jgi:4-hydroxy-2-oxoglutarate aldolase
MGRLDLAGLLPPIPTPFDRSGELDLAALSRNLQRWSHFTFTGFVVLGSNGEAPLLDEGERARLWVAARAAIPAGRLMVAGTGAESTRATIARCAVAADAGADAALVVTPCFYGGAMTPDRLVAHYHAVAGASPIPVIAYTVPRNTHLDLDAATVERIAVHPNVVGLKDSSGNVTKLADVVRRCGAGFQVLVGTGGALLPALAVGAVGAIAALACVAPAPTLELVGHVRAGRLAEAGELQRRLVPVNEAVTSRFGVAGLKAALEMLGYEGGPLRAPLGDLAPAAREELQRILQTAGLELHRS